MPNPCHPDGEADRSRTCERMDYRCTGCQTRSGPPVSVGHDMLWKRAMDRDISTGSRNRGGHEMTQSAPKVELTYRGEDLATRYDEVVGRWLAMADDRDAARAFYEAEVFPVGCALMHERRGGLEPLELLFVPVGTQPYAPILAILGNPTRCVALLETETSAPHGETVQEALESHLDTTFLHVRISDTDMVDIGTKMRAVYQSRGLPSAHDVAADITGGRKPMTAAVAAIGGLYGWRLFYVEGKFERALGGLAHHERIVELANVIQVFGNTRRDKALELLMAGAVAQGVRELEAVVDASAASAADQALLDYARAALALRDGDLDGLRELVGPALAGVGVDMPDGLAEALEGSVAEAPVLWLAARLALDEQGPGPGFSWLVSLLEQALGMELGELPSPGDALDASRAALQEPAATRLVDMLDETLGAGFTRALEALR